MVQICFNTNNQSCYFHLYTRTYALGWMVSINNTETKAYSESWTSLKTFLYCMIWGSHKSAAKIQIF